MPVFRNVTDLLPGLLPAAFRGARFHVVDVRHEVGRRIVFTYFPGVDERAIEDQGRFDGPISIIGLVVGDDYVAQARALQAAFAAPGPGTYLDPWLGEIRAVVPTPARITFSTAELRVARVDAILERAPSALPPILSSFARLLSALGGISAAASAVISDALAARGLPILALAAANDVAAAAIGVALSRAIRSAGAPLLVPPLEGLARSLQRGTGTSAIAAAVTGLGVTLGEATRPRLLPMIGAGGPAAPRPRPLAPRLGARLALAIASDVAALPILLPADEAVRLAARAEAVAAGARSAARIPFESREEALAWRDDVDEMLAAAADAASLLAPRSPADVASLWRAIGEARAALGSDINEIVGRLPRTRRLRTGAGVTALMLAHDLVGDDPTRVEAYAADLVARNRLRYASALPADGVEVLL